MNLNDVWFLLIAVLWAGYFLLEGFDFGVGVLLPVLGRSETQRRVLLNTIGPVWDGNEVWLIVAAGATFAAFPEWYATLFSGFYLPLLLILVALILRGVAFEYRGKVDSDRWRRNWDRAIVFGSLVPAVLWGVAFGNIVRGVALNADHHNVGGFVDLLNPYALLGGLTTLLLFVTHGAVFLALKTTGPIRASARAVAGGVGIAAVAAAGGFLAWTQILRGDAITAGTAVVAAATLVAALIANRAGREGWAFLATAVTVLAATATLFLALYPNVLPSTLDPAYSLTTTNAASSPYTLRIMTWVAVAFTPVVLLYQGWTYWVFRKRIGVQHIPPATSAPPPAGAARP
ncbi:cytochrome d ubiquinol oxidase subunit II [Planosporangium flavigriseum]|uniref:Cytochrome c oxidase assembly protein n=1 Tax=Planosporangium flavigriseum TaxID=373681 RepID=A0A8J3LP31_9ACTN|nr:cytochrome d ubiquinol oxidase subunit II [Planosporangium flavigriseum]NJC66767.1 cytochrome d ubiquinol oxidase subunit II [Planosporangium flavigriseum]GIG76257.1 cytochrome c oxidase assembly protein [Planosporangium flavigriseum]